MIEQIFLLMWLADVVSFGARVAVVLAIVSGVGFIPATVISLDGNEAEQRFGRKLSKIFAPMFVASILFATLTPTKPTIYTYLALSIGVEVAEISGLNETAGKAVRLLNQKLDAELEADENR